MGFPSEKTEIGVWAKNCVDEWSAGWTDGGSTQGPAFIVDAHHPFVAIINLVPRSSSILELLYGVLPTARGRGIATRALHMASNWALEGDRFSHVELRMSEKHVASRRVAESAGFQFVERFDTVVTGTDQVHIDLLYARE